MKPWKIEVPHSKECRALECGAPFQTLADEPTAFRTFAGNRSPKRRGDHYIFIRVRCNDTQCPAIAAFHLDGALVAIGLNEDRS